MRRLLRRLALANMKREGIVRAKHPVRSRQGYVTGKSYMAEHWREYLK